MQKQTVPVDSVGGVLVYFPGEPEPTRFTWEQATREWGPDELTDMLRGDSPFAVASPLD